MTLCKNFTAPAALAMALLPQILHAQDAPPEAAPPALSDPPNAEGLLDGMTDQLLNSFGPTLDELAQKMAEAKVYLNEIARRLNVLNDDLRSIHDYAEHRHETKLPRGKASIAQLQSDLAELQKLYPESFFQDMSDELADPDTNKHAVFGPNTAHNLAQAMIEMHNNDIAYTIPNNVETALLMLAPSKYADLMNRKIEDLELKLSDAQVELRLAASKISKHFLECMSSKFFDQYMILMHADYLDEWANKLEQAFSGEHEDRLDQLINIIPLECVSDYSFMADHLGNREILDLILGEIKKTAEFHRESQKLFNYKMAPFAPQKT